jgi:hypothetical protein
MAYWRTCLVSIPSKSAIRRRERLYADTPYADTPYADPPTRFSPDPFLPHVATFSCYAVER